MLRGNTTDSKDRSTQWTSADIKMLVTTRICYMALTDTLALAFQTTAVPKHVCNHTGVPENLRIVVEARVLASASKASRIKNFSRCNWLWCKGEAETDPETQVTSSFSK